MSIDQTTNGEAPKKPRKGSKAAKRIDELEGAYALAIADSKTDAAQGLRARIERLEQGLPEEEAEDADATGTSTEPVDGGEPVISDPPVDAPAPAPAAAAVSWNDVVAASAEVEANRVERETVEDVIDVKLTEADLADIARANAADDQEKTERQRKVDDLKSDLKDEKTAIDALTARMHDRNNAVLKGVQARKAKWILESIFATNTARYIDPITGRVVHERPLRGDERQVVLPLVSDDATKKAAQMSLGDVDRHRHDGSRGAARGRAAW